MRADGADVATSSQYIPAQVPWLPPASDRQGLGPASGYDRPPFINAVRVDDFCLDLVGSVPARGAARPEARLHNRTVRIVTDSNAMLPSSLRDRYAVVVVPLTIVLDGRQHLEGEVPPSEFFARLRGGASVGTSAPAPGEVLEAYQAAVDEGAEAILSIHVGSNRSATVHSARLAAEQAEVPVTIVDTGTASFMEGCCVWRAAERLAEGASVDEAAGAARSIARSAASVFTIGEIARANDGGRLRVAQGDGVAVFASTGPAMSELSRVATVDAAVGVMTELVAEQGGSLRVGVGDADAPDAAGAVEVGLRALPNVVETIRYTVGPSVAAHTGAGTFGAVYHPL